MPRTKIVVKAALKAKKARNASKMIEKGYDIGEYKGSGEPFHKITPKRPIGGLLARRGGYAGSELNDLLEKGSYQGKKQVGDFVLDKSLSSEKAKVYYNPKTGKTVVAHAGTSGKGIVGKAKDWGNNLIYAVGGEKLYKKTDRYKTAEKVQRAAESKYGKVDTIGHSQGGLLAEMVGGKDGGEILTVNKAAHPFQKRSKGSNQTDIRHKDDIVSKFSVKTKQSVTEGKSMNPLSAHSTENTIQKNKYYGKNVDEAFHAKKVDKINNPEPMVYV
jgi:hypothetical protein